MPKLSLFFSIIFSFLIFFEIKRKGYSPLLAIGAVIIGLVAPILLIPIYLFLSFTRNVTFTIGNSGKHPKASLQNSRICSKCGHENPANSTTCQDCGNNITL